MPAGTRTPRIALLAAGALALLLLARPSEAVHLRVDIVGNVLSTTAGAPVMQVIGVPFTMEIILDADSPDLGPGGTLIAQFDEAGAPPAILSYKIDGVQFRNPANASVRYGRQTALRDFLALETEGGGPGDYDIEFVNHLVLNYFGAGPYSLSQLLAVTEADFTGGFGPEIYDGVNFDLVAEGEVTSFSVSVPEPAVLGLVLAALPGVLLAARRRGRTLRG